MSISCSVKRRDCRRTHHIGWRQARNLREAIHYADTRLVDIGRPLNTFATINFGHIACSPTAVSAIFEKLRDNHFVRWLRYGTSELSYYVWVIENSGGHAHVHWVLHLPKSLRAGFQTKLGEWLPRVGGTITCQASAINIKPVTNLRGLGLYLLKGMDPRYAARFGVRHVPQGLVYGKRCGVSKSLGPASIRKVREASLKQGSIASDSEGHWRPLRGEACSSTSGSAIRLGSESNTDAVFPRPEAWVRSVARDDGWHGLEPSRGLDERVIFDNPKSPPGNARYHG